MIAPLGKIVSAELEAKLETSVRFDWAELRAGDISGRARAPRVSVDGGIRDGHSKSGFSGRIDDRE